MGDFGDVRRDTGRPAGVVFDRDERSASFDDGGKGTAKGEGVCGGLLEVKIAGFETARFGDDEGDGDRLGDFRFHCHRLALRLTFRV